jgi:hypothetical protein
MQQKTMETLFFFMISDCSSLKIPSVPLVSRPHISIQGHIRCWQQGHQVTPCHRPPATTATKNFVVWGSFGGSKSNGVGFNAINLPFFAWS